jgi:hypothetical protein
MDKSGVTIDELDITKIVQGEIKENNNIKYQPIVHQDTGEKVIIRVQQRKEEREMLESSLPTIEEDENYLMKMDITETPEKFKQLDELISKSNYMNKVNKEKAKKIIDRWEQKKLFIGYTCIMKIGTNKVYGVVTVKDEETKERILSGETVSFSPIVQMLPIEVNEYLETFPFMKQAENTNMTTMKICMPPHLMKKLNMKVLETSL